MYIASQDLLTGQRPTAFWAPGLRARPWWPSAPLAALEQRWREIYAEFAELQRMELPEHIKGGSVEGTWQAYHLLEEGAWHERNCALCPLTTALLQSLPVCSSALGYAYFSVLGPGAAVAPHHGASNAKLRGHLSLAAGPGAVIQVGELARQWQEGTALMFDDTYLHAVRNGEQRERVVLLVDLWHPELSAKAIDSITQAFAPAPELLPPTRSIPRAMTRPHVMHAIAGWLPCASLAAAGISCTRWHAVAMDEDVWRARACSDFGISRALHGSWRAAYKNEACGRFGAPTVDDLEAREAKVPIVKVLMLGDSGVGKTCFVLRLCEDTFHSHHVCTLGLDFRTRLVRCRGKNLKLQVWDTAGPERFRAVTGAYIRGAHVVFVCYDSTNRQSFDACRRWVEVVADKAGKPDVIVGLVACRCDLLRHMEVSEAEGRDLAASFDGVFSSGPVDFTSTSSQTGAGVERAAVKAVRRWTELPPVETPTIQAPPVRPSDHRQRCAIC